MVFSSGDVAAAHAAPRAPRDKGPVTAAATPPAQRWNTVAVKKSVFDLQESISHSHSSPTLHCLLSYWSYLSRWNPIALGHFQRYNSSSENKDLAPLSYLN